MTAISADAGPLPVGSQRVLIILAGLVGSSVYEFTWSIAGVALPHMQGTFSATPDQIAWVMTAFIMGTVVTMACAGWLSTRFGTRRVYLCSIAGFAVSLLMCGLATTLLEEVVWRLLQGVFGAALLPLGQAITISAYPPERHAAGTAIWTLGTIGGAVMGPVAGGAVVEFLSWPWVFYLNLPFAVAAFLLGWLVLPDNEPDRTVKLDWFGFVAIMIAVTAFQILFSRGERLDWFASPEIVIECTIGVLALYMFVVHSMTATDPFFRTDLFRDRNFNLGLVASVANGAIATLPLVVLPLMLEQIAGYPVVDAGLLLAPRGIGLVLISLLIARFDRHLPPKFLMIAGFAASLLSGLAMATWTSDVGTWEVIWVNFVQGIGAGAVFISINALTFSTLRSDLKTEGLALYYTVLFTGATIGIAAIVAVLTRMTQVAHSVVGAHINPFNERFRLLALPETWDHTELSGLATLHDQVARQAEMIAYNDSFLAAALVSAVALPLAFLFRTPKPIVSGS